MTPEGNTCASETGKLAARLKESYANLRMTWNARALLSPARSRLRWISCNVSHIGKVGGNNDMRPA
jgi:hypothetical protein